MLLLFLLLLSSEKFFLSLNLKENCVMWKDPIVQEVRKAGEELAKRSNYNLKELFQSLRNNEKNSKAKIQTISKHVVEKK